MDERNLRDEQLAGVSGGAEEAEFPRIAEEFAWKNGCSNCPDRNIYRSDGLCTQGFFELLHNYSMNSAGGARCPRRG